MSEKHPTPTRQDHDEFCANEKWELVRGSRGKPVTHHKTYELTLWDSRILRTRISRPLSTPPAPRSSTLTSSLVERELYYVTFPSCC